MVIKVEKKTKKIIIISVSSIIAILIIALISIIVLDKTQRIFDGKVASIFLSDEEIPEEKAVKKALDRFKEMGEENLKENELEILKIMRSGEYYYYVSSPNNSLEIHISDGKIIRENSVIVGE